MSNHFHQAKTWTTREGDTILLKDMEPSHRLNLLRWMNRNAASLEFSDALSFLSLGGDIPDEVVDDLARRDPQEWLASTPLYRKLRKLVKRDIKDKADPSRIERRQEKARRKAKALHPANGVPTEDDPTEDAWLHQDWREDDDWDLAQSASARWSGGVNTLFASPGGSFHPSMFGIPGEQGMPDNDWD